MKTFGVNLNLEVASALARSKRPAPASNGGSSTAKPRVVLFALFEQRRPTLLKRALAYARFMQAELQVLRILPALTRLGAQLWQRKLPAATQNAAARTLRALGDTRSWLRTVLRHERSVRHMVTQRTRPAPAHHVRGCWITRWPASQHTVMA